MNTTEKAQFLAENLIESVNNHTTKFRKSNEKLFKSMDGGDLNSIKKLMQESANEIKKAMDDWESRTFLELEGLTPKQYYENLNSLDDIIEIISFIEEKNGGIVPTGLAERIESHANVYKGELISVLNNMKLGEDKALTPKQKAALDVAEIMALPDFVDCIAEISSQLEDEKSSQDTWKTLMDVMEGIGEPALEKLIQMLEVRKREGLPYGPLIITLAAISSKSKKEDIYKLIKDYFRSSNTKVIEANAFALYGDGRAIPAIRGYVEKNIEELSYWEYAQFKEAVNTLGGDISDLDEHFYEEMDEGFDEYYYDD